MLRLDYDSGWGGLAVPRINTHTLARRGEEVLAKLAEAGVRLPPGNRIQLAIRTLDELNADRIVPAPDDPESLESTTSAFRTLWEAFFIMNAALERPNARKAFPASQLRYLVKGAPIARGESSSHARDRQCEMFVAAILTTGGAEVFVGEPDLRFLYHRERVGIAVKRMHSMAPDELFKDIKKAAEQIGNQNLRGYVAVNLDSYLDSLTVERLSDAVGHSFNDRISQAHDALVRLADRPAVIGALFFGTRLVWEFGGEKPNMRWANPLQWISFSELEPEERFREFFQVHFTSRLNAGLDRISALLS